jgi:hypothetical protein
LAPVNRPEPESERQALLRDLEQIRGLSCRVRLTSFHATMHCAAGRLDRGLDTGCSSALRAIDAMKMALAVLVVLLFANCAIAQPPQRQALTVQITAEPIATAGILVSLAFRNPNAIPMRLWMGFTPQDANPRGDWFRISADGHPVPYIGPLAKRRAPAAEEFQVLLPGAVRTATMNLMGLYDLPRGRPLTIRFEAYNPSIDDQPLSLLVSNEVHVTLP